MSTNLQEQLSAAKAAAEQAQAAVKAAEAAIAAEVERQTAAKLDEQKRLPVAAVDLTRVAVEARKASLIRYMDRNTDGTPRVHKTGQPVMWALEHKRLRPRVQLPQAVEEFMRADCAPAYAEYHEHGVHGLAAMWGTDRASLCATVAPKKWYDFINSGRGRESPYQHTWDRVFRAYRWARHSAMPADVAAWFASQH